MTKITI